MAGAVPGEVVGAAEIAPVTAAISGEKRLICMWMLGIHIHDQIYSPSVRLVTRRNTRKSVLLITSTVSPIA
jgi:hypothetical protein